MDHLDSQDNLEAIPLRDYRDYEWKDVGTDDIKTNLRNLYTAHLDQHTIVQNKANQVKDALTQYGAIQDKNPETIRNIKWNDYFHKKYKTQTYIVGMILVACILFLLAHAILPEYFPMIGGALLSVLFVYVGYLLWDLSIRDHEIFDEYNFFNYTGTLNRKDPVKEEVDVENCIIKNLEANVKKL
jgi:hypothetical protein